VNHQYKLVFYHFSHYSVERKDRIAALPEESRCLRVSEREDLIEIFELYYQSLIAKGYRYFHNLVYAFSHYDNGVCIDKKHRRLYQKMIHTQHLQFCNPFSTKSEHSFYQYLQEHNDRLMNEFDNLII